MYTEEDLSEAVAAGVLTQASATEFRRFVETRRAGVRVDEERFRLLSGFNDIFVAIAIVLLLTAVAALGETINEAGAALAVAAASWGLAEYFTRKRRMALPSIVLLASFVGGIFLGSATVADLFVNQLVGIVVPAAGATVTALAAWLHWRRFRVPITVAAGALAALVSIFGALVAFQPELLDHANALLFIAGLIMFALAMAWDMRDRHRTTRASDVAFWLHLAAAPLLIHPIFTALDVTAGSAGVAEAVAAIGLYVVLALLSLAIDRRAMLVSALVYVLYAMTAVLRAAGTVELQFALAALVIGSLLLLLSAGWHGTRSKILDLLPGGLRGALPAV